MFLRCRLDGLMLPARFANDGRLELFDGDESFLLESVEAAYYELAKGSLDEWNRATARYRLLRLGPCHNIS